MSTIAPAQDATPDADLQIRECLSLDQPTSFFLYAGAGSGKTYSLIKAVRGCLDENRRRLELNGQQICVITYTNSACEEIKRRLGYDPCVFVSTIHSFLWLQIQTFHGEIKEWLFQSLTHDLVELRAKTSRAGTKAEADRIKKIEAKEARIQALSSVKKFTYNPNSISTGKDALSHSEVIEIGSHFIGTQNVMQRILVGRYPILLIDESQDTNKHLIDALFALQAAHAQAFALGFLGDTMQRIYADGKPDLGRTIPPGWAAPEKRVNHRCPSRVIDLINNIRAPVDGRRQEPRKDAPLGVVRLFILNGNTPNKVIKERELRQRMADITGDAQWNGAGTEVKTLILEHHMAARRAGFLGMYEPLYANDKLKMGLLDGTLTGLMLFTEHVLPLLNAYRKKDEFATAALLKKRSPLLDKNVIKGDNQLTHIEGARKAVEALMELFKDNRDPSCQKILSCVSKTGLFEIPEGLKPIILRTAEEQSAVEAQLSGEPTGTTLDAWDRYLSTPFSETEAYSNYIQGRASFDTHQGVKGLEFERVMVIIDDAEARGFSFSYGKLFGSEPKTKADLEKAAKGEETGIDRTRRLFYVTCSRAERSLAIIAYSTAPEIVKQNAISQKWFSEQEIEII